MSRGVVPIEAFFASPNELNDHERRLAEVEVADADDGHHCARGPRWDTAAKLRQNRRLPGIVRLFGHLPLGQLEPCGSWSLVWLGDHPLVEHEGAVYAAGEDEAMRWQHGRLTVFERGQVVRAVRAKLPAELARALADGQAT